MNYKKIAWYLSVLFHPLLLPTFTFFLLLYVSPASIVPIQMQGRFLIVIIIFILTFLFPVFWIFLLYLAKVIDDIKMENRKDRIYPFLATSFCYTIVTFMFLFTDKYKMLPILGIITGTVSISIFIVTIITIYWKISAHSVGIFGVLGFITAFSFNSQGESLLLPFLITLMIAGALTSARLHLNAHTPKQILAGSILGFVVCFCGIWFFYF